ncbi:MAG: tetratricopeptide repeat protein [Rhodospirillaceae bacterium]
MSKLPPELQKLWNEAAAALSAGRNAEAAAALQRLLRAAPGYAQAWNNLGVALRRLQRWDAAEAAFSRGIALPGGDSESAWSNLGNALRDGGRFAQAEAAFRQARAKGDSPGTRYNYSLLLRDMNRVEEAAEMLGPIVAADPGNAQYRWDYSLMRLQLGDWEQGFADYEARWSLPGVPALPSDKPRWGGEALAGRTLLILGEQGMGDVIQFARFIPLIEPDGGRILLRLRKPLMRLFAQAPALAGVALFCEDDAPPDHDIAIPVGSLPLALGARPQTLPPPLSFAVPDEMVKAAAAAFPPRGGRKRVGLVWAGSPGHRNDRNRSTEPKTFLPLFAHPGVDLYALQVGERAADLGKSGLGALLTDLSGRLTDFLDTAAFLRHLDLLVAVDTGTVHLAGSLGLPTVVATPSAVDWRWGAEGTATPWYASLRLARQPRQGDWAGAMARVMAMIAPRPQPQQPPQPQPKPKAKPEKKD